MNNLPTDFICPITGKAMVDPVESPHGVSYEREAIHHWLTKHNHCPKSGNYVRAKTLRTNTALQWKIRYWMLKNDGSGEEKEVEATKNKAASVHHEEKFVYPLTGNMMVDPAMTKYGHNYERSALMAFVDKNGACRMTGKQLSLREVVSNKKLQWEIRHYHQDCIEGAYYSAAIPEESKATTEEAKETEVKKNQKRNSGAGNPPVPVAKELEINKLLASPSTKHNISESDFTKSIFKSFANKTMGGAPVAVTNEDILSAAIDAANLQPVSASS